ncbi:uncharacterized protein LOC129586776 isoform X2 [Paramacrobiotus metropolitanus]|uniref:uncharacterized protein LOC129586776 isoform X2 n=1 Tax=Paramacrobiotus metropolitanus TaxID=2943436 RepID=UPI0024459A53|nr:uncharacterized protein LOC129586776 isoform X2 [Paramacrobiotus metropolitanus]
MPFTSKRVIERLREVQRKHTHELGALAAKLEDTMQQKDIMNRENERYRIDTKETEEMLNKIIKEHDALKTEHVKTIADIRECRRRLSSGQPGNVGSVTEEEDRDREPSKGNDRAHGSKGSKAKGQDQSKSERAKSQGTRAATPGGTHESHVREDSQSNEHEDTSHSVSDGAQKNPHEQPAKGSAAPPVSTVTKKSGGPRKASVVEQIRKHHEPEAVVAHEPSTGHGTRPKSVGHEHPPAGPSEEEVGEPVNQTESEVKDYEAEKPDQVPRKKKAEAKKASQGRRMSRVTPEEKTEMKKLDLPKKKVQTKEKEKTESKTREVSPTVASPKSPESTRQTPEGLVTQNTGEASVTDKAQPSTGGDTRDTSTGSRRSEGKKKGVENANTEEEDTSKTKAEKKSQAEAVARESQGDSEPEEEEDEPPRSPVPRLPRAEEVQMAHKEIQTNLAPKVAQVSRGIPVQASFIGGSVPKTDVEVQPSFADAKTSEQEALAEAQEQLDAQDETISQLSAKIEELQTVEEKAKELEDLMHSVEREKSELEVAMDELRVTLKQAEDDADVLQSRINQLEYEVSSRDSIITDLQHSVDTLEETLRILRANKITVETSTVGVLFGTSLDIQTEDVTPPEVKEELKRLKSILGHFRKSLITVLAEEDLVADIPSFPHQLKDTWNAHSAAAEITDDVRQHFGAIPAIFQGAFTKLRAEHRAAFTTVLEQKASEMEGDLRGTDSSEEMRRARMKLRQRVLDLEVENTHIRHTLKQLNEVLEQRRSEFDTQLDQKKAEVSKYRDELKRIKELAWTLAESLAKLRDEAVAAMPERKSIVDMISLLRSAEKRLGKTLKKPLPQKLPAPQMQAQGAHQETFFDHTDEYPDSPRSMEAPRSSVHFRDALRSMESNLPVSPFSDAEYVIQPKPVSLVNRQTSVSWTVIRKRSQDLGKHYFRSQGTTTTDRISRSYVEYTRYSFDPHTESVQSETRKVTQEHKMMQTTGPVDLYIKGSAYTGAFPRAEDWNQFPEHSSKKKKDTKEDEAKKKPTTKGKETSEPIVVTGTRLQEVQPELPQPVGPLETAVPAHGLNAETTTYLDPKGVSEFEQHRNIVTTRFEQQRIVGQQIRHKPQSAVRPEVPEAHQPQEKEILQQSAYGKNSQAERSLDSAIALLISMEAEAVEQQVRSIPADANSPRRTPREADQIRKIRDHVMHAKALLQEQHERGMHYEESSVTGGARRRSRFDGRHAYGSPYSEGEYYRERSEGGLEVTQDLRNAERQIREDIKEITRRRQRRRSSGGGIQRDLSSPESGSMSPAERSAYRRQLSRTRKNRLVESKRHRQRRVSELDQAINRFLRQGQVWDQSSGPKTKAFHSSLSPKKTHYSPEKPALGSHKPIYIGTKVANQMPPEFTAVGLSLEPGSGTADFTEEMLEAMPPELASRLRDMPRDVHELPRSDHLNATIAQKLKFLKEQRIGLTVGSPEKIQANPLIRTHRGEEPLEGPIDTALNNFPEMGVIGRGIPDNSPVLQQWNASSSTAKSSAATASMPISVETQVSNAPKPAESQTRTTSATNTKETGSNSLAAQ